MSRRKPPANVAASVRQRLLNHARERSETFDLVLTRFGLERLLYRVSRSRYRDDFVLKGAMLFQVWSDEPHRPTRDLDLAGRGENSVERLVEVFREICREPVEEDGLEFNEASIRGEPIRENQEYQGLRMLLDARLAGARIPLQVDVGFGDAITPGPVEIEFPTLLELPAPVLKAYPKETVVAEKLQAMVMLGIANTRMKDYYDVWVLCRDFAFDGSTLAGAIRATFERRATALSIDVPVALSDEFASDQEKRAQWRAFLRKTGLGVEDTTLEWVIPILRDFLMPPVEALRENRGFRSSWPAGGPWRDEAGHNTGVSGRGGA